MTTEAYPPLDITAIWARVTDELIELIDTVPDDKMDWSPKPQLWSFRGILLHIAIGPHFLMGAVVQDGTEAPDVLREGQTRGGLKEQLRLAWRRMEPFLSDSAMLAREYEVPFDGQERRLTGHWLAFGQFEHYIHHRADIYHYLDLLGIEHGQPDTIERRLREG